jgi:hypothetical protein
LDAYIKEIIDRVHRDAEDGEERYPPKKRKTTQTMRTKRLRQRRAVPLLLLPRL